MSAKGTGYIILNVLRGFNLIGLALVMVASWVMIVLSGLTGQFFFFDFLSHFWTFAIAAGLTVSELGIIKRYFAGTWPVLSEGHSLAWLGLAMIVLGTDVLGTLNKAVYSIDNLSLVYWRLIMASGILAITFGCFNILASIFFRDAKNGITARGIRADGKLAQPKEAKLDDVSTHSDLFPPRTATPSAMTEPRTNPISRFLNPKSPRKAKVNGPISGPISGPIPISVPMPAEPSDLESGPEPSRKSFASTFYQYPKKGLRPPTQMHPAYTGDNRSSRYTTNYSVANMERF